MTRNWIAVNLLLLLATALLGWQLNVSITRFNTENDLARLQPFQDPKQKITQEGGLPPLPPPKRYNATEFANIPAQNLFSDTRTKDEKVDTPVVVEIPVLQVKPVLVGVTISGTQRLAAIVDPTSAATARKTQSKQVGDTYQGYTITDITQDKMILENGNRKEIIPLFDASKHPGQSGKTAIQPTRIVAFGGGGAGGASAGAAVPVTTVASRPGSGSTGAAAPVPAGAQSGIARTPTTQAGRQIPGSVVQQPPAVPGGDQGRRVIRTPFGDVVRPANP